MILNCNALCQACYDIFKGVWSDVCIFVKVQDAGPICCLNLKYLLKQSTESMILRSENNENYADTMKQVRSSKVSFCYNCWGWYEIPEPR